jgi:oxygen-dependent protoporphyrinogen oxidase
MKLASASHKPNDIPRRAHCVPVLMAPPPEWAKPARKAHVAENGRRLRRLISRDARTKPVIDLIVVGGGLTGLTVALRRSRAGARVVVLEGSRRLGGQLHTERTGGFVVEHGAEGFVAGSEAVQTLAEELGVADRLVDQLEQRSYGFDGGRLVALAAGEAARFLGFQVPAKELGRGIRAFRGGMQDVIEALVAALGGAELYTQTPVIQVEPLDDGVRVTLPGVTMMAREVVLAIPAVPAAGLMEGAFGEVAADLRRAALSSSVTVSLAYPRVALEHALDATGLVVAESAQIDGFRACTFTSSKLPARAPAGSALLRLFYRPSAEDLDRLDDRSWIDRAQRSLASVLPVRGAPEHAWVARWANALPIFDDAHRGRVAALEQVLVSTRVRVAGSAFHGSGIDAAVRSAFRVSAVSE